MSRSSIYREDHYDVAFWLIFDNRGGVRLTRIEPGLARNERGMQMSVKVPHALFKAPALRATMTIEAPEPVIPPIDLTAAADALKQAIGMDLDIQIISQPPTSGEEHADLQS